MMTSILGRTRVCGVMGDPIEHTMSPVMHNAAFTELGLDYIYLPFLVTGAELEEAVAGIKALHMRGMNVTIPHKVSIIPLLDEIDEMAMKIGAVNTVVNDDGALKGYNTDAPGFLKALREAGVEPSGARVAVLGAGGAARAISYILGESGAHLTILNRALELDWAQELAGWISRSFRMRVKAMELSQDNLREVLEGADILVNATSVGMNPDASGSPLPAQLLRKDLVVFDAVYNPLQTRLLQEAAGAGAKAISGIEMLVWQGALSLEIWTGQQAPFQSMREAALRALGYEG